MKKILVITGILLCLLLLNACEGQDVIGGFTDKVTEAAGNAVTIAEEVHEDLEAAAAAEAASPTGPQGGSAVQADTGIQTGAQSANSAQAADASAQTAAVSQAQESTSAAAETQEPASPQTDFTSFSADQCVADQDGLPHIVLDCDGARSINEDVEGFFRYLIGSDYCTVYYEYYKNAGRVLSIMVAQLYDGEASYFTPFNLDLATGRRLSGSELLSLLGAGAAGLADAELQIMGQEFEYQYGGYKDGDSAALYEEQYARTISTDNADTERIWLSSGGSLYFVAKIYSMSGAEYYEYPMDTGLRY